jgi:hypothetical protein
MVCRMQYLKLKFSIFFFVRMERNLGLNWPASSNWAYHWLPEYGELP